MEYRHCPHCGKVLERRRAGGRLRPVCRCGFVHWRNPAPGAAVVIEREGRVLWVRRNREPRCGLWSLPSGFLEWDEDIRDCAVREAREETGLEVVLAELLAVYSVFDDPRGNTLLVVYRATVQGGEARPGDDAGELDWFPLRSAPAPIAWEPHRRVAALLAGARTSD